MTDHQPRRGLDRIFRLNWLPARLFGGRVRTSTFILVVAWLLAYMTHAYLNPQPEETVPPPAAETSVTQTYVPPPVPDATSTQVPTSTESVPSSSETTQTPASSSGPVPPSRGSAPAPESPTQSAAPTPAPPATAGQPGAAVQEPTSAPEAPQPPESTGNG